MKSFDSKKETTARLLKLFDEVENPDWFEALVMIGFDETQDLDEAITMALEIIKDNPNPPDN